MANKSSNKPIKSAKLTGTKKGKFEKDFSDIMAHYAPVLASWGETTPEQRADFLNNSPVLKSIIEWGQLWQR